VEPDRSEVPAAPGGDDLGSFIREQRRLTHLSLRKLAEAANVSNPYLSQIERGLRKPSAEILQQIARALSISAETLYVRAGILEDRETAVDVIGEIRRDPHLTADQRQALVRIYRAFRAETGGPVLEPDRADQESSDDEER
jgi:transcriptional regulator with XRE-family HTH domain